MQNTKFDQAFLLDADFEGADLFSASLNNANLLLANFKGAKLGVTTLPDGSKSTSDTDLSQFTDSEHPNFWRPIKN